MEFHLCFSRNNCMYWYFKGMLWLLAISYEIEEQQQHQQQKQRQ